MMIEAIFENFKFLTLEVQQQVKHTFGLISEFDVDLMERIQNKDDYIDNLKTIIENRCFSRIHGPGKPTEKEINEIRAIHVICINLERIADFCVNISRQIDYLSPYSFIHQYDYTPMFVVIQNAMALIPKVFNNQDMNGAFRICEAEQELDSLYKINFDRILGELSERTETGNLITTLFIFRYLERIGDSILNIGEALLFAITGDRIKIRQFEALRQTLEKSGLESDISRISPTSIWGSRSGCRITRIQKNPGGDFDSRGLFKEGAKSKIRKEKKNLEKWQGLMPGLVPDVLGYEENNNSASMLIEFFNGQTMEETILTGSEAAIRESMDQLENIITTVWDKTRTQKEFQTDFMSQLDKRMSAILQVHPAMERPGCRFGSQIVPGTRELIRTCERIERDLPAPATVFVHGDFNVNNILISPPSGQVHFIDFYRSGEHDFVQDASVFLISNFRLPVFENLLRQRLNDVMLRFYHIAQAYADKHGDTTFAVRMALALVRSFYTSTRFELNQRFAMQMFLRAHYLMEQLTAHRRKPWKEFRLPLNILLL